MASMNKFPWTYSTYAKLLPTLTRTPNHTKGKEPPPPENRRGRVGNFNVNSKTNKIRMNRELFLPWFKIPIFPPTFKPVWILLPLPPSYSFPSFLSNVHTVHFPLPYNLLTPPFPPPYPSTPFIFQLLVLGDNMIF